MEECRSLLEADELLDADEAALSVVRLSTEVDDEVLKPSVVFTLGLVAERNGDYPTAQRLYAGLLDARSRENAEITSLQAQACQGLARCALEYDDLERALKLLDTCEDLALEAGEWWLFTEAALMAVGLLSERTRLAEALDHLILARNTMVGELGPVAKRAFDEVAEMLEAEWGSERFREEMTRFAERMRGLGKHE